MFVCAEGHLSSPGERRILVPVQVRSVETVHTLISKEHPRRKTAIIGTGMETVREVPYCQLHAPQVEPAIVDRVTRTHTRYVTMKRDEDEDEGDD